MENKLVKSATSKGFVQVDVDVLLPVSWFLDLHGEDIRQKAFTLPDQVMGEICIRPDFTVPVSRMYSSGDLGSGGRYFYKGDVFHRPSSRSDVCNSRSCQFGIELIGKQEPASADEEVFVFVYDFLRSEYPKKFFTKIGDISLARSWIETLDIPSHCKKRLLRHFRNPRRFNEVLDSFSSRPDAFEKQDASTLQERKTVSSMLQNFLLMFENGSSGIRTLEDIAEGCMERANTANAHISKEQVSSVIQMLQVSGNAEKALPNLRELAKSTGVMIDKSFNNFERRLEMLVKSGIPIDDLHFDASFGRDLEYYDGFVFEMGEEEYSKEASAEVCSDLQSPFRNFGGKIGGGGRYDKMISSLCNNPDVSAVGGALNLTVIDRNGS